MLGIPDLRIRTYPVPDLPRKGRWIDNGELSNYHEGQAVIRYRSVATHRVEPAYVAAKNLDALVPHPTENRSVPFHERVARTDPARVKRLGAPRARGGLIDARPDWEEVCVGAMWCFLVPKFAPGSRWNFITCCNGMAPPSRRSRAHSTNSTTESSTSIRAAFRQGSTSRSSSSGRRCTGSIGPRTSEADMSYKDFQDAVALADSTDGSHKDFGPVPSEDRIKASEALLGCRFPPMYREFVSRFGCGGIGSNEVWGPVGDDLSLASPPNVVGMNLDERSSYGLPDDVLLICAIGNGEHYALDLSHVDESGEPQVIVWPVGGLDDRSDAEVVATDFGEFLLSQFQQALENINARDIPER